MTVSVTRLQCEHYALPLGIQERSPRLSWRFEGESNDWTQASYEIEIKRSQTENFVVSTAESVLVPWPSSPLADGETASIRVRSIGNDGLETDWSTLTVEAGIENWSALPVTNEEQPTDAARRPYRVQGTFIAPESFKKARLYITAYGVYEAEINGKRLGDEYLAPGWTSYHNQLVYRTYELDVQPGENVLGAWVGEGWYTGKLAFRGGFRNCYGTRPALIAQVVIDGRVVLATDKSWKWSYGAVILSELQNGEIFDSNLEVSPSLPSSDNWKSVEVLDRPTTRLVSSQSPPVQAVETLRPIEIITTPSKKIILDFGQNFAGLVRFVKQPTTSSKQIVIRHAEVLEHGELGVRPLRAAKATDTIIVGGNLEGYIPKFTSHGFRYIEVTGWDSISLDAVVGIVTHSAMERTGHFKSSHALINKLHENVVWSTIGNTISIPTDCPQRDERLGWTGDIQVFSPTLNFLYDSSGFLKSWLKDVYYDQLKLEGNVPVTVPDILQESHNRRLAIWGDVAVLTPIDFYTAFGDIAILQDQYESAAMWLEKGVLRDETGLWRRDLVQLGDWLAPAAPPHAAADGPTDVILTADAYLIHTTKVMSRFASILGRQIEATKYATEAQKITDAFYAEYVSPNGRVMSDTQTALTLLIQFDIFPSEKYLQIFGKRLSELVTKDEWKVATGFAGTPIILQALAKVGALHQAYRMLQSKDTPSWLSPVLLGATTIWERWDSMLADGRINPGEMTSFNHYALGSVAAFLHSFVGGLSPLAPGWKEILIKPQPGGTITSAKTSFNSPYGLVECDWKIDGGELKVDIKVPPNTTAKVELPGGVNETVGSGVRSYTVAWTADDRFPPKEREFAYRRAPVLSYAP